MNDQTALTTVQDRVEIALWEQWSKKPPHRTPTVVQEAKVCWRITCIFMAGFFAFEALIAIVYCILTPEDMQCLMLTANFAVTLALLSLACIAYMPGWFVVSFKEVAYCGKRAKRTADTERDPR